MRKTSRVRIEIGTEHLETRNLLCGSVGVPPETFIEQFSFNENSTSVAGTYQATEESEGTNDGSLVAPTMEGVSGPQVDAASNSDVMPVALNNTTSDATGGRDADRSFRRGRQHSSTWRGKGHRLRAEAEVQATAVNQERLTSQATDGSDFENIIPTSDPADQSDEVSVDASTSEMSNRLGDLARTRMGRWGFFGIGREIRNPQAFGHAQPIASEDSSLSSLSVEADAQLTVADQQRLDSLPKDDSENENARTSFDLVGPSVTSEFDETANQNASDTNADEQNFEANSVISQGMQFNANETATNEGTSISDEHDREDLDRQNRFRDYGRWFGRGEFHSRMMGDRFGYRNVPGFTDDGFRGFEDGPRLANGFLGFGRPNRPIDSSLAAQSSEVEAPPANASDELSDLSGPPVTAQQRSDGGVPLNTISESPEASTSAPESTLLSGFARPETRLAVASDINGDGTLIFRGGKYSLAGFGTLFEGSIGSDLNGKFTILNYDAPTNRGIPGYDVLDAAVKSDINSEFRVVNVDASGKAVFSHSVSY